MAWEDRAAANRSRNQEEEQSEKTSVIAEGFDKVAVPYWNELPNAIDHPNADHHHCCTTDFVHVHLLEDYRASSSVAEVFDL